MYCSDGSLAHAAEGPAPVAARRRHDIQELACPAHCIRPALWRSTSYGAQAVSSSLTRENDR